MRSDRLTSLPEDLLIHILSLLPTKDVGAMCILNRRLRSVFPFIRNLDFDANKPISFCVHQPYAIHRYPIFVAFVNTVLQAHQSKYLNRFRLQVGHSCSYLNIFSHSYGCERECLPDLESKELIPWISFPLNLCGLVELDLCILLRDPGDTQLPVAIFTCQTLEVLKLETNLGLDQVFSHPSYHLPNLRFLTIRAASYYSNDDFLPRLLACCPLLEDLTYAVFACNHVTHVTIQSASLRRLSLEIMKGGEHTCDNTDVVLIDTPALEYLRYDDNLALCYSIPMMPSLVTAHLSVEHVVKARDIEPTRQQIIKLITSVSYAERLSLSGIFLSEFHDDDANDLKRQLPMLPNLKYLEMGYSPDSYHWNTFLLHLLNLTSVLEVLKLPEGVLYGYFDDNFDGENEDQKSEREFLRAVHRVPSCCKYHLRRIVIEKFLGISREIEIVEFFLRHALVLQELIIYLHKAPVRYYPVPDQTSIARTLMNLPKASVTCSIQVLWPS